MLSPGYSKTNGIVMPEIGWTPPIRYLLRRNRILSALGTVPAGKLLEIGCGAGALLYDLARMGFVVQGLETSDEARATAEKIARQCSQPHGIHPAPQPDWNGGFDLVCAFDVLEHIEDDHRALDQWLRWLAPHGRLVLSVPAHRARWGQGDVWAGHWRRYDRQDIQQLIQSHGLEIQHFECYGFPLANATEWLGNRIYRKLIQQRGEKTKEQASASSGIDRRNYAPFSRLIASAPGRALMSTAFAIQSMTRNTDWGSGYLLVASRR
ncbi:class I SAM-dependent methyltransferase [Stenotrophomonas sp. Y-13]|uniref:class I SAM-dependent methyltransferase n=1 Tax=Stenotrophomonas sp. Y-13 TaxID=3384161 RepID=UPI00391747D2